MTFRVRQPVRALSLIIGLWAMQQDSLDAIHREEPHSPVQPSCQQQLAVLMELGAPAGRDARGSSNQAPHRQGATAAAK